MAFFREDEELQDEEGGGQGATAPISAGSAVISSAGGGPSPNPGQKAPDKSGNFVGIHKYLEANKNQGAKLGDQTAGIINQSAQDARTKVGELSSAADQAIKPVMGLSDDVKGKISSGAETLSAQERQQIKDTAAAQYKGPKAATDLGDAYTNAQKASQTATQNISNADTEQGRMNLVTQINSKPRTTGMNVFDNALLQAGGGREKIAQAAGQNQDVKGALDQATQEIQGKIGRADDPNTPDVDESTGAIGATNKAQADAYKSVQDAMNAWKQGFQPKVAAAQQGMIDQQNRVTQDIADNPYGLSEETMALLGLNEGDQLFGIDLNNYLGSASPSDISAANVASAEDYARYAALADLAGEQDLMLRPEDSSMAGKIPQYAPDTMRLKQDRAAAQQAYDNAYKNSRGGIFQNFTAQEVENSVLPYYRNLAANTSGDFYQNLLNQIQSSFDQWQRNQLIGNVVKKG